jgi:hypothetical protein
MEAPYHQPRRLAAPQGDLVLGRLVPILLILLLPLLLGAWQDVSGNVTVVGGTGYLMDLAPAPTQRFYRIAAF